MIPKRREFPAKIKVAAYRRSGGNCEGCTAPLTVGKIHYDHIVPDALGGEPTLENCACICTNCHDEKTAGQDVPRIAKANRARKTHIGAKSKRGPSIPGSRDTRWKRKLSGEVVER